eukprot:CAMPEP_0184673948 /NCGR_PEP_ID=MMETSP0308-20130426/86964_1 /TAXON_ID=38269 /ORGANISM="Gloeochaete witrockiana, Strain SAG 46.84" /LENGTH=116 /DNA_ID=CAMNT_0027121501 /DNA_START=2686 /DNA_END=3036 /DNA_ORIENTATION=-
MGEIPKVGASEVIAELDRVLDDGPIREAKSMAYSKGKVPTPVCVPGVERLEHVALESVKTTAGVEPVAEDIACRSVVRYKKDVGFRVIFCQHRGLENRLMNIILLSMLPLLQRNLL